MMRRASFAALAAAACMAAMAASAAAHAPNDGHSFGVIGHSFAKGGDDERLKQSIEESSESALAFVVLTGIKAANEPCSDKLYLERRKLISNARRPMIVMPSATDWSGCKNSNGRTAAIERLNRVRELYYAEPESLGRRKIEVTRQSANAKFRSYAENMYWVEGNVLYATVNIPANNNHYLPEAGRNSEFEDRLVANRYWLNRVFALARAKKHAAVVLFSEGDIKPLVQEKGLRALLGRNRKPQDGFDAPRRQVAQLARKFRGKVLLVDTVAAPGSKAEPVIEWQENIGHVSAGSRALEVHVSKDEDVLFTLKKADAEA
ncbi:hypothetical protein ACFSQU_17940 [Massilia sp. GCM10020059]|uniref:Uncharacterized protein n=1 Tax=Massilia agrisoli TaxID=2892444 RepID=A0ABS8ITC5_9BURK|nr:hypothetical protein [Massilia agrisoli]MCC6071423.1 hypothetical protein [Massilia agrisoli]